MTVLFVILPSVLLLFNSVESQFVPPEGLCPSFTCNDPCLYGYARDGRGCQICGQCLLANGSAAGDPLTNKQTSGPSSFMPCLPGTTCTLDCPFGYYKGPRGCDFCVCALQSSVPATYNQPCGDSPTVCDVTCTSGYVTGTEGCQYCKCRDNTDVPTTAAPVTSTTPSWEECVLHYTKCQLHHPYGFMSDAECTLCIDKDEIYKDAGIPADHQPTILLSNPCIKGFDICKIFCSSGYKSGPRSCHFCACLH